MSGAGFRSLTIEMCNTSWMLLLGCGDNGTACEAAVQVFRKSSLHEMRSVHSASSGAAQRRCISVCGALECWTAHQATTSMDVLPTARSILGTLNHLVVVPPNSLPRNSVSGSARSSSKRHKSRLGLLEQGLCQPNRLCGELCGELFSRAISSLVHSRLSLFLRL